MNQKEMISEYTMFLGVYRARISRAKHVKRNFASLLEPLATELVRAEKAILDLEKEAETADAVIIEYEEKLESTKKLIDELSTGGKVFKDAAPRKKPGRIAKLMRLQHKLAKMFEEDPALAELLEEEE